MIGDETKAARVCRVIASIACAVLAFDLVLIVVTGGLSILTPEVKASPAAFALREALLALALVARLRLLASEDRRLSAGQLMLMLAILPSLFHLHFIGRRITGDGVYYYVYTRSNRRFDSLLPVFALGLAAFLQAANAFVKRRPAALLAGLVLGGAAWNVTFVRAVQTEEAKHGASLSLAARSLASSRALSHDVGFPTTWPASWIFAARYDTPGAFDLAAGKYLFYRQNNLGGVAEVGSEGDEALILDGFSSPKQDGPITYRDVESEARLIVSLDLPETLGLSFQARAARGAAATSVEVRVNGTTVGTVPVQPGWGEVRVEAPQPLWERGPNIITLRPMPGVQLERVTFLRPKR